MSQLPTRWLAAVRFLWTTIEGIVNPLVWMLGLLPPVMLNAITSFCAALFIVFIFGFGTVAAKSLRSPQPVICLESCNS